MPRGVSGSAGDGFIKVDVAVSDFYVEAAVRISADPCLVLNGRTLASIIG